MSIEIKEVLNSSPVVPVLVIENLADAVPLANALYSGGLKVLEITLRTECALDAVKQVKEALPQAIVGTGSVVNHETLMQSVDAGADFIVSPGFTGSLIESAKRQGVGILPGVNSPSEIMALMDYGLDAMKFFPAELVGGAPMLKAISGPLPNVVFCPTGGISAANAKQYLSLPNVACVGGSWLAPKDLVAAGDWQAIEKIASDAVALGD